MPSLLSKIAFTALICLRAQSAFADCPIQADAQNGFVLGNRSGESSYNVRVRDDNSVWVGFFSEVRAQSANSLSWSRVTDHGVLVTEAASNWSKWTEQGDLSVLTTMGIGETIEIDGLVNGDRHDGAERAVATFRLLEARDVVLGDCIYAGLAFGAKTEVFKADGTTDRLPGHFTYIPELMIAVNSMWDGGLRNASTIRKATADDWFGE